MKTKTIENGKIKVWYDNEEEFIIVGKNEPLYNTLIDANLLEKKYSKILLEDIKKAGLDDIHGVFIDIDNSLQSNLDNLRVNELDEIFSSFNSVFSTNYKYLKNSNGLISILFGKFDNYQEFVKNYFCTFLLKMFDCKIDILKSEEKDETMKGLTNFISNFADDYLKKYLETSKTMDFPWVINFMEFNF
jgi:hypothetical protein